MNQNTRRYLDENWDDLNDPREQDRDREREERKPQRPDLLARKQHAKEWGRSMAKFHRDRKKAGLTSQKP